MPLPFLPPLSPHEQAIFTSLPKCNGSVVSPDYAPHGQQQRLEREFLAWCEAHERRDWPQWVNDWEIRFRLTHRGTERPASAGADPGSVRSPDEGRGVAE